MTCPNCGSPRDVGVECPFCHCIYEKAERHLAKKKRARK